MSGTELAFVIMAACGLIGMAVGAVVERYVRTYDP